MKTADKVILDEMTIVEISNEAVKSSDLKLFTFS